ncbi:MAG: hypothetical protein IPI11_04275 [Haliscomenobacter sp.]|nr:hypothetical protein [Haliscomenobacter sp.]
MLSAVKVQKDLELVKGRISDGGKTEGFKPGSGAGYTYDGNGNLKSDPYKGISSITYNHLNLPKLITFSSGNTIEIIYDASGNKLRKIVKQGATVQYEQDYSGGIEYRKTPAAGTFRIEAIYHEEGRYFNLNVDGSNTPSWRKEYALRDHLGSTRLLFADKDGDGMVEVYTYLTLKQSIKDSSPWDKQDSRNMDLQMSKELILKSRMEMIKNSGSDLYLTINTDSCVFWEHHDPIMLDVASTHYCFTGRIHDFFLGGKKYASVFKFRKTTGIANRVVSSVITDENFYLVEEEFLEGYSNYYRIERRE